MISIRSTRKSPHHQDIHRQTHYQHSPPVLCPLASTPPSTTLIPPSHVVRNAPPTTRSQKYPPPPEHPLKSASLHAIHSSSSTMQTTTSTLDSSSQRSPSFFPISRSSPTWYVRSFNVRLSIKVYSIRCCLCHISLRIRAAIAPLYPHSNIKRKPCHDSRNRFHRLI